MKKILKRTTMLLLTAIMLVAQQKSIPSNASNKVVLQEINESKTVTSGLTYEKKSKLTNLGWVDIYVLKMDLSNENVDLDIIRSVNEWSKKNTLTNMMAENQVIGAINASFFDMSKNPSDVIGVEFENGSYSYLQENYNKKTLGAASMMVTEGGEVNFSYFSGNIIFRNAQYKGVYISSINGVSDFVNAGLYNRNAMVDTSQIESKANLYKIVVEEDTVIEIVEPKKAAKIPENGYVVTVNEANAEGILPSFEPGVKVALQVNNNFGDRTFKTILSGGGTILKNGQLSKDGMTVSPNSRNPRTAIGTTSDGKYLIAMVVDGRGSSIGATHEELAAYLKEYGVNNAIHMDGGGSSTIAARNGETNSIELLNAPSDGSQRRVVNGIGFVSTAPEGELARIEILPPSYKVFKNSSITYRVIGFDQYENPVEIDENDITWSNQGIAGTWKGTTFTALSGGEGTITSYYGDLTATAQLTGVDTFMDLNIEPEVIYASPEKSVPVKVVATDKDGYKQVLSPKSVSGEMDDPELGYYANGMFYAGSKSGTGILTLTVEDMKLKAYVVIGSTIETKTSFETENVSTLTYPDTAVGKAERSKEMAIDGSYGIKISYDLPASDATQAVYSVFEDIFIEDSNERSLGLNVYGDNSNVILRARLVDANNTSFLISFSNGIDFKGWKKLEAKLPEGMTYPVKLERIYVASLKVEQPISGALYFDLLTTEKVKDVAKIVLDKVKMPINDPSLLKDTSKFDSKISVVGSTSGKNNLLDQVIQNKFIENANQSNLAIFAGNTQVNTNLINKNHVIWNNAYKNYSYDDFKVITLATGSGGLVKSDYTQWTKLQNDLKNTSQNNIIIIGNKNPMDSFSDTREGSLFHTILRDYQKVSGKTIYYINAYGYDFDVNYHEGIHYFDINGLYYHSSGNKVDLNNNFYMLNFYVLDGKLYYNYENLYPQVQIK